MEAKPDHSPDNAKPPREDLPKPVNPEESKKPKENSDKESGKYFVKTKNDKEWADKHCVYIFDKYVNTRDDQEEVDVESKIYSVMKDLHILFRIDENPEIANKAKQELGHKPVRTNKYFREKLYEWIADYRELSIATYLAEGINLVTENFDKNSQQLKEYFELAKTKDPNFVKTDNLDKVLEDVMEMTHLRLICLDHTLPKDDSAIIKESESKEYMEVLKKCAEVAKIQVLNSENIKNFILMYLKSGNAKYSFAYLPKIDEGEGLDPYADLGEASPNLTSQNDRLINEAYHNIDEQIEEAEEEEFLEKAQLLKRIRQLLQVKKYAQSGAEIESIISMIEDLQTKIDNLGQPELEAEGEGYEDGEGEGEDFDQYEIRPDQSRVSQQGETLEERRDKGLKEIFDHYAKSQMLIGRKATFEDIQHEISNLNLGEYMKFCKDFKIPCNKVKVAEVFKKTATNSKELFFDDFKNSLWKLFETRDQEEIEKLKKRLREIRKISKAKKTAEEQPKENKDIQQVQPKQEKEKQKVDKPKDDKEQKDQPKETEKERDKEQDQKKVDDISEKGVEKQAPKAPQVISRPKGGDPKNVETLQNLQNQRDEEKSELLENASTSNKQDDKKKDNKAEEEINKKEETKGDSKQKSDDAKSKQIDATKDDKSKAAVEEDEKPEEETQAQRTEVDELELEKQRILKRIEELRAPTQEEYQEEILAFLE